MLPCIIFPLLLLIRTISGVTRLIRQGTVGMLRGDDLVQHVHRLLQSRQGSGRIALAVAIVVLFFEATSQSAGVKKRWQLVETEDGQCQ